MHVRITGWRSKNLRGYLRDFSIEISTAPKSWSLLQMPNGTGKTTTMDLMRIAFQGEMPSQSKIMSFRADDAAKKGFFELSLSLDGTPHKIRLNLDFQRSTLTFKTTSPSQDSGGLDDGHWFPMPLEKTLKSSAADLFVFDGELASTIISEKASDAEKIIRSLYRLDAFSELRQDIQREMDTKKRASRLTQGSSQSHVDKLQQEYDEVLDAHKLLKKSERALTAQLSKDEKALQLAKDQLSTFAQDKEEFEATQLKITAEIERLETLSDQQSGTVLQLFRVPPRINPAVKNFLDDLGRTLETNKLPRSLSSDFFKNLSVADHCVCGRPISDHERDEILEHMDEYLAVDEIAVINHMRSRLQDIPENEHQSFSSEADLLKETMALRKNAFQRQEALLDKMKDAGFEEIEKLTDLRDNLTASTAVAKDSLTRLTRASGQYSGDWESNLTACDKECNERKRRLDAATQTRSFRLKADALEAIVSAAENLAKSKLATSIRKKTNKNLANILRNETLEVSSIKGHLQLTGENAQKKDSASEGQKLAVAYAFISALLKEANHELPFVVDSPAVSLDLEIRRTVGKLIQPLFDQMIMFVISSEREGFADTFFDNADAEFFTISFDQMTGRTNLVKGLGAFKDFHVEAEN
jgi:DNA sulfur modification protein DndD|tara:strand:- start:1627 stop:3552 length:1926 start_codon:yes stop_codon:yes gene_type:complete